MYKRFVDNVKEIPNMKLIGRYGIPLIHKQDILLSSNTKSFNNRNTECVALHFFIDDYQFDRLWNHPERYVDLFKKYEYICSPDYSLYLDFPKALQIYNTYKKQFLGAYYQSFGIKVVPTVSWSDEESYSWCFDGIEKGSCVACSSVGCMKNYEAKTLFIKGFEKMIEVIDPIQILMVGELPEELSKYSDVCFLIKTFHEEIRERTCIND